MLMPASGANYLAALVLLLTPAISVELLTGDTPLAVYFTPITFFILNIVYGGALLLLRETVVRWGKGFASVLVLAAGYGMENEAITSKGFFDPHFYALGGLEGFGRTFGINVPWALNISIAHAVLSIIIPLTIVSAIFGNSGRWIGNKVYATLLVVLIAVSAFAFKVIALPPSYYHYDGGPGPILLILALMAALILLAWKLPSPDPRRWQPRMNAVTLFVFGVVYANAFIFLPSKVQTATGSPGMYIAFLLAVFVALPIWLVFKMREPTARGKVALVVGLLAPVLVTCIGSGRFIPAAVVLALIVAAWLRSAPACTG